MPSRLVGDRGAHGPTPRPDLAGVPQHVVQRGNNRMLCFLDDEDRWRYLQCLREALLRYGCALHAYVLMSNHVHLLLTPSESGAVPLDADLCPQLCRSVQWSAWADRDAMGRSLQIVHGRLRALCADLLPLH